MGDGQLTGDSQLAGAIVSAGPDRHRHDNRYRYLTGSRTTAATGALPQARAGTIAVTRGAATPWERTRPDD